LPGTNREALQKSFLGGRPAQGLFNDEGGQFFGGHAMNRDNCVKTIGAFSKLWDDGYTDRARATADEKFTLYNRRLAIHLMVQPIVVANVLTDRVLQGQGIMARFLICEAQSLAGTRFYSQTNLSSDPAIIRYYSRAKELLSESLHLDDDGGLNLESIELTDDAKSLWIKFFNATEAEQRAGGELELIKPVASKIGENVLRIAGVISVLEGRKVIEVETMAGALTLGEFYLQQALRIAQKGDVTAIDAAANELLEFFRRKSSRATIQEIRTTGPRKYDLRKTKRIRHICAYLVRASKLKVVSYDANDNPAEWEVAERKESADG